MRPTGKVNFLALLFMGAIAAGLFYGINYGPAYVDNLEVREAVVSAYNQAKNTNDPNLRIFIKEKVRKFGTHKEYDNFGQMQELPGLGLKDEQILIERDTVNKTVTITVEYEREIELKPLKRSKTLRFIETKSGPLLQ
jgi:hypothetical protein